MKLEVTWKDETENHARIENADIYEDKVPFEDKYVSISGYFGNINPNVFAAAPDLLEALEMAQLWLDVDGRFDMHRINAAIAKAKGVAP